MFLLRHGNNCSIFTIGLEGRPTATGKEYPYGDRCSTGETSPNRVLASTNIRRPLSVNLVLDFAVLKQSHFLSLLHNTFPRTTHQFVANQFNNYFRLRRNS